ncbi:hypothetical protein JCM3774_006462 [Rhodotorula dairenensis]
MPAQPAPPVRLPDEMWTLVFEQLGYFGLRRIECVCKRFRKLMTARTLLNAFEYQAIDEYATTPACRDMVVTMAGNEIADFYCRAGVTVRVVPEASVDFWLSPTDNPVLTWDGRREMGLLSRVEITLIDLQGERNQFRGFSASKVDSDGSVLLDAPFFQSEEPPGSRLGRAM